MKSLLIDNYDSFTFNLYQYLAEVNRTPPIVVRNDSATWEEIQNLSFDNIVISPGPGRPENDRDFGVCRQAILNGKVPVLGVCLGHQGICDIFGGKVDYANTVMHGRPSSIIHTNTDIFSDIPSPFTAIRYHSLYVPELSDDLEGLAWTEDGILMGVKHKSLPIWGVQFHPESIGTEYGHRILENFRSLTIDFQKNNSLETQQSSKIAKSHKFAKLLNVAVCESEDSSPSPVTRGNLNGRKLSVHFRRIPIHLDAEQVFMNLYSASVPAFWLDSALVRGFSRFSYMGDASGPNSEFVSYDVNSKVVTVSRNGDKIQLNETIFDYLERELKSRYIETEGLPFDFNGGYAGYLGYELKSDCGGSAAHRAETPDAGFIFADRLIAFDHEEDIAYLVCVDDEDHDERAREWLTEMSVRLQTLEPTPEWSRTLHPQIVQQSFRHPPDNYLDLIDQCKREIKKGESYEVCLTNMIKADVSIDPLNTYRALRSRNPSPYATYLSFPDVAVLSSSPERFLTIDPYGVVDAKPIKGTRKRGKDAQEDEALFQDLRTNEKDRSENLMIVDLLRNDIGTVCSIGSVHVSNIFSVESYKTVHQLVSSIRGKLRRGISSVKAVQAAFPAGSMTGAPKKRTMEIIDKLEAGPRGIYSGSIGFFGLNSSADLSVVIRTIIVTDKGVTVGVGGAIIDLSDPQDELEETILKSRATINALSETSLSPASIIQPNIGMRIER